MDEIDAALGNHMLRFGTVSLSRYSKCGNRSELHRSSNQKRSIHCDFAARSNVRSSFEAGRNLQTPRSLPFSHSGCQEISNPTSRATDLRSRFRRWNGMGHVRKRCRTLEDPTISLLIFIFDALRSAIRFRRCRRTRLSLHQNRTNPNHSNRHPRGSNALIFVKMAGKNTLPLGSSTTKPFLGRNATGSTPRHSKATIGTNVSESSLSMGFVTPLIGITLTVTSD